MINKYQIALMNLRPNTQWSVQDNDYTNIIFDDPNIVSPTIEELDAELLNIEKLNQGKKLARQTLLEKLGITEEEARLLLGGN